MSSHFKKDPGAAPGGFSRPPESGMTGAAFTVFTPNVHAGPTGQQPLGFSTCQCIIFTYTAARLVVKLPL